MIDGLTGDQRFFLAWAQVWRAQDARSRRAPAAARPIRTRPTKPGSTAIVRNFDAWYKAFDVKPGDKLYLAPRIACASGKA